MSSNEKNLRDTNNEEQRSPYESSKNKHEVNNTEYISSGILELYVTGALTHAERSAVEAMAANNPEIQAELDDIQEAMNAYSMEYSAEPPANLKNKILAQLKSVEPTETGNVRRLVLPSHESKSSRFINVLAIAASVALLVSIPLNIYLFRQVSSDESKITAISNENKSVMSYVMSRYSQSVHDSSIAYTQMRTKLYVLTDPMFKMIKLNGLKVSPDAKAMVCWCPDSKELYFEPDKLPPAPKGMQYQLWAIVGGKPIDAGMVQPDAGMQKMKQIANATAFAVTLEKEGGSPAPKGDMYVMGNI